MKTETHFRLLCISPLLAAVCLAVEDYFARFKKWLKYRSFRLLVRFHHYIARDITPEQLAVFDELLKHK